MRVGVLVTSLREGLGWDDLRTSLVINRLFKTLTLTLTLDEHHGARATAGLNCYMRFISMKRSKGQAIAPLIDYRDDCCRESVFP